MPKGSRGRGKGKATTSSGQPIGNSSSSTAPQTSSSIPTLSTISESAPVTETPNNSSGTGGSAPTSSLKIQIQMGRRATTTQEVTPVPAKRKSKRISEMEAGKRIVYTAVTTKNIGGNFSKKSASDDISLLRGGEGICESSSSAQTHRSGFYKEHKEPVYYPSPNVGRSITELTEEEQVQIAKRIGLIENLPIAIFNATAETRECVICFEEFVQGDEIRHMQCPHIYHIHCIDTWLMRSFTCPSCMEPVDGALFNTYETTKYNR